jgi:D-aspartate ligase
MRLRVLATDVQERSMLAAIRCLHTEGFEVTAVASGWSAPGLWSLAPAARLLAPDPRDGVDDFIQRLVEIVRERRHDVLLPGTDASLLVLSRHRDRLAPYVLMGLPAHETVVRSFDRGFLANAAGDVGLAPPEARTCVTVAEAVKAADLFGYPVVVKPLRTVVEVGRTVRRWASQVASDAVAVDAAARKFGTCVVQRWARGDVISFSGVMTDRGLRGYVVSRYVRTWPPHAGNVCFSETISPAPGLVERVEAVAARIGWEGLFELELIRHQDGRLAAIDFNPRAYGSLSLAAAAGVPLAAIWCGWIHGDHPVVQQARVGVRYRWEDADFRHLVFQLRRGRKTQALAVLKPTRGVTHAYARLRDPAPVVARAAQLLLRPRRPDRRSR